MNKRIPNTLRMHRKGTGLRQIDVAQILGLGKRGDDSILRWERGYAFPTIINLFKLSALYNVLPEDLYPDFVKVLKKELSKKSKGIKSSK